MQPSADWKSRAVSAADALSVINSGDHLYIHGAAATPTTLLNALAERTELENVRLYHLHLEGECRFLKPEHQGRFFSISLFTGPSARAAVAEGRADFMPIFLKDIPRLFRSHTVRLDVALLQVSPPDRNGMCTLGTSVDAARAAVDTAKMVIAEINEQMPRTHGHAMIPLSRITAFIATNRPLPDHPAPPPSDEEAAIGEHIANLVEDGATLQLGIGAIPNAVLARLGNKFDLGVHTEMFSDGLIPLVEGGVITNRLKKVHPGRIVTSFVLGSRKLYDFVDDNLRVEFHPCDRTNDTALIRKNDKVTAVNSALEIDLTGQICADSIGTRIYSGIGGQMDFIHGAALSAGGKPIIALPATAANGTISRIAPTLKPGAGVVTEPRARALGGHGVRRGQPARQDAAGAGRAAHLHRPPGLQERAAAVRRGDPSLRPAGLRRAVQRLGLAGRPSRRDRRWPAESGPGRLAGQRRPPLRPRHRPPALDCHAGVTGLEAAHAPARRLSRPATAARPAASQAEAAHRGLVRIPGNAADLDRTCGAVGCHPEMPPRLRASIMITDVAVG